MADVAATASGGTESVPGLQQENRSISLIQQVISVVGAARLPSSSSSSTVVAYIPGIRGTG